MRKKFSRLVDTFRRWLRRQDADAADPYARVRAPLGKRPGGRSGAVALEEPD